MTARGPSRRIPPVADRGDAFHVLVVDDEVTVLDLMADILRDAGFAVDASTSALDSLRRVRIHRYDALVLDVYMPELPGMLFHAKVRLVDAELASRTVFVSGHFTREELRRDLEQSQTLLSKPFRPEQLVAEVRKLLPGAPRSSSR